MDFPRAPCANAGCAELSAFFCGACHDRATAGYCSRACQRAAWRAHKPACLAARRALYDGVSAADLAGTAAARGIATAGVARAAIVEALVANAGAVAAPVEARPGPPPARARDWTVTARGTFPTLSRDGRACLVQLVTNSALGDAMRCDALTKGIEGIVFAGQSLAGRGTLLIALDIDGLMAVARRDVHAVYVVNLNAAQYSFAFETRAGAARVFQSFIEQAPGEGFSAREWLAPAPAARWRPALRAAHAARGGGRELGEAELRAMLELIRDFFEAGEAAAAALARAFPAPAVAAEAAYWQQSYERARRTPRVEFEAKSPIMRAVDAVVKEPNYPLNLSMTFPVATLDDVLFTNDAHAGAPLKISVPSGDLAPFRRAFLALTGHDAAPSVFLNILKHKDWKVCQHKDLMWGIMQGIVPDEE